MNMNKYVYVSPQQFVELFKEWHYEYVVDGVLKRSPSFGYHQGKDYFKRIELEAWRLKKELRKLNTWDWPKFLIELHTNAIYTLDGDQIRFFSKKQQKRFNSEITAKNALVKVIRQFSDGDIVLHHIFEDDGRLLGFVVIIGPRGGVRSEHGFDVETDDDNQPYLVRKHQPFLQFT